MAYTLRKKAPTLWSGRSPSGALITLSKPIGAPKDSRGWWNLQIDGAHLIAFPSMRAANLYLARVYGPRGA